MPSFLRFSVFTLSIFCSIGDEAGFLYSEHILHLQAGDTVYLYTDGYGDQKGGPNGKKFTQACLKALFQKISTQPCAEQKQLLSAGFEEWKGSNVQRDDVLIVGIKLPSFPSR